MNYKHELHRFVKKKIIQIIEKFQKIRKIAKKKGASLKTGKPDRERKTGHCSEFGIVLQCPVFSIPLP